MIFLLSLQMVAATPQSQLEEPRPLGLAESAGGAPGERILFNPGEVVARWTAPHDNGATGRACGYDLRYLPYAFGPINSFLKWQISAQVACEPLPSAPGQRDSIIVAGLPYGAGYFFCIRSYDDCGNYSPLSNSPLIIAGDTSSQEYILGDVNNSGYVNGIDLAYLAAYFKGINLPPMHMMSADVNGDCTVNGLDVVYMTRYFRGGPDFIHGNC